MGFSPARNIEGEARPSISALFLRFGVLAALLGIAMGIGMGASQDFRLSTAHAHLNLLGWVSMVLCGLFYRIVPSAGESRLATAHAVFAIVGVVIFVAALALLMAGPASAEAAAHIGLMVGPALILAGMSLFAIIVFLATRPAGRSSDA